VGWGRLRAVRGGQGGSNSPGAESLRGHQKGPTIITFFNAVYLLPKDLRFEHGGAKLASCPAGAI